MKKLELVIRILIEILYVILLHFLFSIIFQECVFIKWICTSLAILILVYFQIDNNGDKQEVEKKAMFNTYYINYPKVFEIAMLADNKIRVNAEETLKEEKKNKYTWGHSQKMNLESEYSESTNHEYKEIQEIKNTYSTYLREVLKNCDKVGSLENLKNGQLIRIDDVKLEILNKEEILEANSLLSGAFNGNTLDTYSDGHMFKININSLTNMILKDYKYHLNCIKGK